MCLVSMKFYYTLNICQSNACDNRELILNYLKMFKLIKYSGGQGSFLKSGRFRKKIAT